MPRPKAPAKHSFSILWQAGEFMTTVGLPVHAAHVNPGWEECQKVLKEWSPLTDKWELYNIDEDWSQANDLAAN